MNRTDPNVLTELTAHLLEVAIKIRDFEQENTMKKLSFSDQFTQMNDWALQRVQRAAIPTDAYVYAIENELPCDPAQFEQEAQHRADYLESVLCGDGETTPAQRTACTIAVTFFENCGILTDADVYGSDRVGLVAKCKQFAYGTIDRAAEQERDAQRQMGIVGQ